MSLSRNVTGREFKRHGPATEKLLSPRRVRVLLVAHVKTSANRSDRRPMSVKSWQSSARYCGSWPCNALPRLCMRRRSSRWISSRQRLMLRTTRPTGRHQRRWTRFQSTAINQLRHRRDGRRRRNAEELAGMTEHASVSDWCWMWRTSVKWSTRCRVKQRWLMSKHGSVLGAMILLSLLICHCPSQGSHVSLKVFESTWIFLS